MYITDSKYNKIYLSCLHLDLRSRATDCGIAQLWFCNLTLIVLKGLTLEKVITKSYSCWKRMFGRSSITSLKQLNNAIFIEIRQSNTWKPMNFIDRNRAHFLYFITNKLTISPSCFCNNETGNCYSQYKIPFSGNPIVLAT